MRLCFTVLLLSVVGCRGVGPTTSRPARLESPRPMAGAGSRETSAVRLASAEMPLEAENDEPADPSSVEGEETVGPSDEAVGMTLEEAIETTLRRNPALVALRQSEPVGRAALRVARSYPFDPSVQATAMPGSRFAGGRRGSVVNSVQITQTLELAHQPRYRWQAGSGQLSRIRWNITEAELRGVAETERRFFAVLYRRKLHELTGKLAELNEELLGVLRRRYDAGQATAADVALAEMEARSARQQADLAEAALQTARLDFQAQLGLPVETPPSVAGDVEQWTWSPAEEALASWTGQGQPEAPSGEIDAVVDLLVAGRPDVQAARADLQAAVAEWKLAWADRVPNLDLGPAYERNEDKTVFWGVTGQVQVPIFQSRRALAFQRRAEVRQKQVFLQQLQRQARMEIRAALDQYERGRSMVERFHAVGDEQLARQVQSVEDLFQAGQADLLRVYAARSRALQVRMDYLQSLDALARAAGDLIASSGIAPEVLATPLNRTQP